MAKTKIPIPKKDTRGERFTLINGEEVIINHMSPGYGKGGILSMTRASDGYSYGRIMAKIGNKELNKNDI